MKYNVLSNPEARIIEAANKVFLKYGVEAATMMQIADEAGLSRTSLHYYYRDKAHLFEAVFRTIEHKLWPALSYVFDADVPVIQKVEKFVNEYIQLIVDYPMIPGFMSSEIQRNPQWINELYKSKCVNFDGLRKSLEQEASEGKIRSISVEDLIANTVGMCVFPTLSKPVYLEFVFQGNEEGFNSFMQQRKKIVMDVITAWLRPVEITEQSTTI